MATAGQNTEISPDQNLSRYLQRIRQFPMLEVEEERQLARRWQKHKDPEAASRLVNSHLRLVAKIAKGFLGYGLPLSELISDGNVEWQDWLVVDDDNQEIILLERQELDSRRQLLVSALDGLSGRERHILSKRRLSEEPVTLQVLSEHYGISRERVRQIEVRAFEKVQKSVRNAVIERHVNH